MATTTIDRFDGLNGDVAIKAPCRAATIANITLSGEQTIDDVAVVAGDRVLVKNQSTASENGIYTAATSGWTRALDFDGTRDVVTGTLISVNSGTTNGATMWRLTNTGTITIGSTSLTFAVYNSTLAGVSAFMSTVLDDATAADAQATLLLRERLTADRTYYVRTDGSDSNNGLANTAGGAFLTIQKAWDTIVKSVDLAGFSCIIQVADGTYSAGVTAYSQPVNSLSSNGGVAIVGNASTPANCVVNRTAGGICFDAVNGASFYLRGFKLTNSGGVNPLVRALRNSLITIDGAMEYGASTSAHIQVLTNSTIQMTANYTISGAASAHIQCAIRGCYVGNSLTVTLTGTPAFSSAFISVSSGGYVETTSVTYSGSATGVRYAMTDGSVIKGATSSTFFPGNSAGTATSGCVYSNEIVSATQAQMEAASVTTTAVTPGVMHYHPGAFKAWVVFTSSGGTYTAQASYNYTSFAKNATGDLTITWAVTMSNANYGVISTAGQGASRSCNATRKAQTTTTTRILVVDEANSADDTDYLFVGVVGDI